MKPLRLAAAAEPVGRPDGVAGFRDRLARLAAAARAQGADMLLLAEYFAMDVAAGSGPDVAAELARAVALADALVAAATDVARMENLWLLPGSFAMRMPDGKIRNQAPLIAPDGTIHWTQKHRMTRFEAEEWGVDPGTRPTPIETPWGRVGVAICYDSEFPPLTRALAEAGCFLLLVPACTDSPTGWTRVEVSARACAIQNQIFVATAPTIGAAPWSAALDTNHGRAAIFGPADRGFPPDGVLATGPMDSAAIVVAELDPARLETVRRDGAVRNFRDWPQP